MLLLARNCAWAGMQISCKPFHLYFEFSFHVQGTYVQIYIVYMHIDVRMLAAATRSIYYVQRGENI